MISKKFVITSERIRQSFTDVCDFCKLRSFSALQKELVHSFKKLPEPNSSFLEKITSGMVESHHMKLKKICPAYYILFISSVELFEIPQKKATFWKSAIANFFNIFFKKIRYGEKLFFVRNEKIILRLKEGI